MLTRIKVLLFFTVLIGASVFYSYQKLYPTTDNIVITQPFRSSIRQTIVANGSIVPREEVSVKPRISGIVTALYVEPGDKIEKGGLIALVEPQPDPVELNKALMEVTEAEIRLDHATGELSRGERLRPLGALSEANFRQLQLEVEIAQANLAAAMRLLEIVKTGTSKGWKASASEVRATVDGTVLERPVQLGSFVIETNTFNEGSTIVSLANMDDLIFTGEVDEQDAGQLRTGMPVEITIGAFPNQPVQAKLDFVAPQSSQRNEASAQGSNLRTAGTSFQIKANLATELNLMLRAGFSATAVAEISRVDNVVVLEEKNIRFHQGEAFVETIAKDGKINEKKVLVGLSDGLNIEITKGLSESDQVVSL